jgi:hypothetical protein
LSQEVTDLLDELKSDELAQECLITKRASGAYDPATGTTSVIETTQTVLGSIFDSFSESASPSTVTNINSSLIKSGDRILLLSAIDTNGNAVEIEPDFLVSVNGRVFTAITSGAIDPGGVVINYIAVLRG